MEQSFSERVAEAKAAVTSLSAREAAALREGCEEVVFIDPRPADAIVASTGSIPGARNIVLGDIEAGRLPQPTRIGAGAIAFPLSVLLEARERMARGEYCSECADAA